MPRVPHMQVRVQDQIQADEFAAKFDKRMSERERYNQENSISKSTGRTFQKFYVETKIFTTNNKILSDCNDITFYNTGSVNVIVNDLTLIPNQTLQISGNAGEIDTTQYTFTFPTPNDPANQITILRKLFV
jgi:hypothetical protein